MRFFENLEWNPSMGYVSFENSIDADDTLIPKLWKDNYPVESVQ